MLLPKESEVTESAWLVNTSIAVEPSVAQWSLLRLLHLRLKRGAAGIPEEHVTLPYSPECVEEEFSEVPGIKVPADPSI